MTPLTEIIGWCEEELDPHAFSDVGPNGLQIEGRAEVTRIATGVSANREFLTRAAAAGADLAIVHHGLLWDYAPRVIDAMAARRLRVVLEAEMSLAMFHFCLDGHLELGNGALLAGRLGCVDLHPFGTWEGRTLGVRGSFPVPLTRDELVARVRGETERVPFVWPHGPDRVETLVAVTGAGAMEGSPYVREAAAAGVDAFVTGEATEHTMAESRERGINFIAAGHHATEVFGVQALGDRIAEQFGVEHVFIDVPNPI